MATYSGEWLYAAEALPKPAPNDVPSVVPTLSPWRTRVLGHGMIVAGIMVLASGFVVWRAYGWFGTTMTILPVAIAMTAYLMLSLYGVEK